MKTSHNIEVACHAELAFEICLNVARWPYVFPPCLDAKVIEESEALQQIFLTAKANEEVFSWYSTRQLDRKGRIINFVQGKPSPLVKSMEGSWTFVPKEKGCVVTITHDFEVKEIVDGLVKGVNTQDDALKFMLRTIENNSTRELRAIKNELERSAWTHEFSETVIVDKSKMAIYQLLRDVENWPWLLPHCNSVEMIYQDPNYQEFVMNVQVGVKEETIRSIRFLHQDAIEYFQPDPPPALSEHRGRWSLRETDTGIEVTSWHSVVLNADFWIDAGKESAKQTVESAINRNSLGTIESILKKLEECDNAIT